ncbi:MAG: M23 family metallopeptidase [Candidatus Saccharimonadaceae bacterium]
MSKRRNGVVIGVICVFVAPLLFFGYLLIMVITLPAGLILNGGPGVGAGTCQASGTIGSVVGTIGTVGTVAGTTAVASPSSSPTAAPESALLPQETLDRIEALDIQGRAKQNMERYTYAQEQTGVPWAVIAALHYREAGMRGEASILNGQPILGTAYKNVDGKTISADPKEDAVTAANALKGLAKGVYDVDVTKSGLSLEEWGRAFLSYNRGYLFKRADVPYTASPYVMNGFDAQHMNMHWSRADTVSGIDGNKIGALAILTYLNGQPLGKGLCSGVVGVVGGNGTFVAPIKSDNIVITSGAGQRARYSKFLGRYVNRIHFGLDLVGGSQIVAVSAGTVTIAQDGLDGLGTAVKIDHGNGTQTLYGHMVKGSLKVSVGQAVKAGQTLGTMGETGDADGVHVHFEVWLNDVRINPYPFLIENGVKLTWKQGASPHNEAPGPLEG